jgi:sulfur carrier protein
MNEVQVNGEWREFPADSSVAGLLEHLGIPPKGIAVAVNGEVLCRDEWDKVVDPRWRIDVLTAVQGG